MQAKSDAALLREYAEQRSELAFGEIVARHAGLVYSAALRQVGSPELARDLAQSVFTDLARKAMSLTCRLNADASLAGWLYRGTHYAALTHLRDERRRQAHERQAMEHLDPASETSLDWDRVRPVLDEAMANLSDDDREALLLRFFKNQDFRAVGAALGVSDDAAQKRVMRSLEKLRAELLRRGVTATAAALSTAISVHAVEAAPTGLVATLTSASLAGASAGNGILTLLKAMATTKLKVGVLGTAVAASALTSLMIQHQSQTRIREADASLRQQGDQLADLQVEHDRLSNLLTLVRGPSVNNRDELERLRNQVATLRGQTNELAALRGEDRQLKALLARARQELRSPNVQPTVQSEEARTKTRYAKQLALAALEYAAEHQAQFPTNLEQAVPFLATETRSQTNFSPAQFEILFRGTKTALNKYAYAGSIILVRERQPWRNTDGKWVKAYAFSDGHGEILSLLDGNFQGWEEEHIVRPDSSKL